MRPRPSPVVEALAFLVAAHLCLLVASFLKEDPRFWLNEGGYPVLLRDLVRLGYYPFFGLLALLDAVLTTRLAGRRESPSLTVVFGLGLVACWILLGLSGAWIVTDNLLELLQGP